MLKPTYLQLKELAKENVEPWDEARVDRAFELALRGHEKQFRQSGEDFIYHPLAVARIVADLHCDLDTFLAAILHDVVEDTDVSLKQLSNEFGRDVAFIVDAVTKVSEGKGIPAGSSEKSRAESLRKIIVGIAKDLRVSYIKLSDRLHNLTTLVGKLPEKRTRTVKETRTYFSPLARELGIGYLHRGLEHWSLRFGNPEVYDKIKATVTAYEVDHRRRFNKIWYEVDSRLRGAKIACTKVELPLRLILIEQETLAQARAYHDIKRELLPPYNLTLVFETVDNCYTALGIIHSLWSAISCGFGDWMAIPLPNGYSAIHTLVQTKTNDLVTFQLRTEEMHQRAEWGSLFSLRQSFNQSFSYEDAYQPSPQADTLRRIIDLDKAANSTEQFLEYLRLETLRPKVRIYLIEKDITRFKGDIIHIPMGATVLDLAYLKDPSIGHACRGAIVNNESAGVDRFLYDGEIVRLQVDETTMGPDPSWEFGKTYTTATAKYAILNKAQ